MEAQFELGKNEEIIKDYFIGTHGSTSAQIHLYVTNNRIITYGSARQESIGSKHHFYYMNDMKIEDFAGIIAKSTLDKSINWGKIIVGIILMIVGILPIMGNVNGASYLPSSLATGVCIVEGIVAMVGLILLIMGLFGDSSYSTLIQIKSKNLYGGITMMAGGSTSNNYFLTSGINNYTTSSWLYVMPTQEMYKMISELSAIISDILGDESEEIEEEVE